MQALSLASFYSKGVQVSQVPKQASRDCIVQFQA